MAWSIISNDQNFVPPHAKPPRTFKQDWDTFLNDEERNPATAGRRTLLLVPLGWSHAETALSPHSATQLPGLHDVAAYLEAFTTLPCRIAAQELKVVDWQPASPRFLAVLTTANALVRVRCRRAPDGEFAQQLNCSDLLDALSEELPEDVYSIVGLTFFDIHDDGQLVGGRAYGGSRIAVISLARYHPDFRGEFEEWPHSHPAQTPLLSAARAAASASSPTVDTPASRSAWWLAQVAVTVSHEVGHCMGLEHCTAYSCYMGELEGQPPYACPDCLRKLLTTAGGEVRPGPKAALDRYVALASFCAGAMQSPRTRDPLWAAMEVWVKERSQTCSQRVTEVAESSEPSSRTGAPSTRSYEVW